MKNPTAWNWCHKCKQLVDVDDGYDGQTVRCWGCRRYFTVTYFNNGKWALLPEKQLTRSRRKPRASQGRERGRT